jgi:hypothetical protein
MPAGRQEAAAQSHVATACHKSVGHTCAWLALKCALAGWNSRQVGGPLGPRAGALAWAVEATSSCVWCVSLRGAAWQPQGLEPHASEQLRALLCVRCDGLGGGRAVIRRGRQAGDAMPIFQFHSVSKNLSLSRIKGSSELLPTCPPSHPFHALQRNYVLFVLIRTANPTVCERALLLCRSAACLSLVDFLGLFGVPVSCCGCTR